MTDLDLSNLDPAHHARFLLAAKDSANPAALLATFEEAWPATTARLVSSLSDASEAVGNTEASGIEEEAASIRRHLDMLATNKRRLEAAKVARDMALRDAYASGCTAYELSRLSGLSVSTINKTVAGIRKRNA